MANSLTGEFDVVAEISLPAVNRALAAQHQSQVYLHSFRASLPSFDDLPSDPGVRGFVDLQVSTPGISLPVQPGNGSSRLSVHYKAMVRYTNTSTTPASLPEFVHGEIVATLNIQQTSVEDGDLINVDFVNNVDVKFSPSSGSGLPAADVSLIEQVVLNFLRKGFEPVNVLVTLPSNEDFKVYFWRFKIMPGQAKPAVALLMNLKDVVPSPGSVTSFNTNFLDDQDDFAIAIGSEFIIDTITGMITHTLKQLDGRQFSGCVSIPWAPDICSTYTLKIKSSSVKLGNGVITFTLTGDLTSPDWYAPNFSFKLEMDFGLLLKNNRLGLISVGGVRLSLSSSSNNPFKGFILRTVREEAEKEIELQRNQILNDTRDQIGDMLSGFDAILTKLRIPNVGLTYSGADIQNSGVITHGKLGFGSLDPAKIFFTMTVRNRTDVDPPVDDIILNGFDSWIPGGTIQQYSWSGLVNQIENHQFITKVAGPVSRQPKFTCLALRGTQGNFFSSAEVSEAACSILSPLMLSPFLARANVRNHRLPAPITRRVLGEHAAQAHIDLRLLKEGNPAPAPNGIGNNLVIHFSGSQPDSLTVLRDALNESKDKSRLTFAAAVVPEADLENSMSQVSGTDITLAVDPEGGWKQTFSVGETPATFILDPGGNIVWQQIGSLNLATLSAALKQNLSENSEPVRWQQLQLRLKKGDKFPDFLIKSRGGDLLPLRRLFGPPMWISFWTSWSAPCLKVLQQLQIMQNKSRGSGIRILAINDGEDPERATKFFTLHNLTLNLFVDQDRRISKLCGVSCWPTTVLLKFGLVQQIYYGVPELPRDPLPL